MMTIRTATQDDVHGIRDVIDDHIVVDNYAEDVGVLVESPSSTVAVAVDDDGVQGVTALKMKDDVQEVVNTFHGKKSPSPEEIDVDGNTFAILTTGYVAADRLGQGIGHALLAALLQHASETGVDAVYAEADLYNEDSDGRRLLDRQGFERLYEEFNDYWPDEGACSRCDGRCECGGIIYRRRL